MLVPYLLFLLREFFFLLALREGKECRKKNAVVVDEVLDQKGPVDANMFRLTLPVHIGLNILRQDSAFHRLSWLLVYHVFS